MSAEIPGIIHQITKLASDLRLYGGDGASTSSSAPPIASLAASLNFDSDYDGGDSASSGRVLDAALSLMCFNSEQVAHTRVEYLVRTIISVLNGSISCHVSPSDWTGSETLHVGSSISPRDCNEIICLCKDVLIKLKGHNDGLAHGLFSAILENITSLCYYKEENGEKISKEIINNVMNLESLVPEFPTSDNEIPFRVFKWYFDPSILKHEISKLVQETVQRPFICLRRELHENESWHDMILCLISSPTIFMNSRTLLHSWFLQTGSNSILDLQNAIISSLLDILSRPIRWGIPIENGLNYPFSHAYFPNKHRELFSILCGPVSCSRFVELFDCINSELDLEPSLQTIDYDSSWYENPNYFLLLRKICKRALALLKIAKNSSILKKLNVIVPVLFNRGAFWQLRHLAVVSGNLGIMALAINFPNWFYFATTILFQKKDSQNYISKLLNDEISFKKLDETKLIHASSQYLAWILHPIDKSKFNSLTNNISHLSISWVKAKNVTNKSRNITRTKKLSICQVDEYEKPNLTAWLKEFCGYCNNSSLYFKIPLGILITSFNSLDSKESELLLHFATTGGLFDFKKGSNLKILAIKCASLVLNLFDTIEEISFYLFEFEDVRLEYLSQFKGKIGFYLIRCLKILLEMRDFDRDIMLDLYKRLAIWKEDGMLSGPSEFDYVFNDLSLKCCS